MQDLLNFCLSHIPKGYISTHLIESFKPGFSGALEIKILSLQSHRTMLFIDALALGFNKPLRIIIFNYKPYHYSTFKAGSILFIQGTLESSNPNYGNTLIMTNPKTTKETNTIKATFKQRGITLANLQKQITLESLLQTGISSKYANAIYEIFHPSKAFFEEFNRLKGYPKRHLDSIKFIEIYIYIQRLSKKKLVFESKFQCSGDIKSFIKNLPFALTKAQSNAIEDIKKDLSSTRACRRIIMGDVGCGKTMVILASVVIAYPQKSILMAPTSILARQLYIEAKKYLPPHINISYIVSDSKNKDEKLNGDFIIGTQALLYREGDFSEFALVMTDEQHRFGTAVRARLEKMLESRDNGSIKKPHNIQFSATPIPRTMAMLQSNIIDFSFIKDLPFKKDITTYIINKDGFKSLMERIKDEIAKDNQVAVIYPLIEENTESEKKNKIPYMPLKDARSYWERHFESVFVTYGSDKEKEDVLQRFGDTRGAILLATTMVEVGISLPHLTIIVIVGAERLGLASLHQLRGRVSRNGEKGYCYLFTHNVGNERLVQFSKTLSGFDIAELDLQFRNSGDLLDGIMQSGANFAYFDMAMDREIMQEAQDVLGIKKVEFIGE